jgi:dTDP-4-dehydrorhamnose 3,5-epimerase-like enzyme
MNKDYKLLEQVAVSSHEDHRGFLGVCEFFSELGFEAKRFYYISEVDSGVVRGRHAHKTLKQVYVCLSGQFTLSATDGELSQSITLHSKSDAVYVKPGLWREMLDFSSDAICLVIASHKHDPDDYIFDFEEYKRWRNEK